MNLRKSQELWNIALFILSDEETVFDCSSRKPNKIFTPQTLIRTRYHQITGYADPFLFTDKNNGYLYLFYEQEILKSKAPICAKRTRDLKNWENLGIVLKEPHHLSYPNVFAHNEAIYMLPETHECNSVILYQATEFPFRWRQYKTLVNGDRFTDSCLLHHEGKWYLFSTVWFGKKNGLRIFVSDTIDGNYIEHPKSPITDNIALSRCGGSIFSYNGNLYRPAQYCTNYYGEDVHLYKIIKLTPTEYQECLTKQMVDKQQKWNCFGGHHINTTKFNGKQIVVMDGIVNDNWFNNHTRKIFNIVYHLTKK